MLVNGTIVRISLLTFQKHEDHCLGRLDDIDRLLDDGEAMMFMGDIPQSIVQDNERAIDDTCREMYVISNDQFC